MTPQQLAQRVENLFSFPDIYFSIKRTIENPKSDMEDVAAVVSQDPNIASRLLRMANSPFFGFATEIDTVKRAISVMGLMHVHNLVLAVSATKAFKGIDSGLVSMKDFWIHSVFTATLAKNLASKSRVLDSERLFVSGLLHDIGHLVIYTTLPNQASKILQRARNESVTVEQLEREIIGFDYAQVGCALLKEWKLPESLYMPVQCHTQLRPEDDFALDSAIVHIANRLALRHPYKQTGFLPPSFEPAAFQLTELTEADLEPITAEARKSMTDILTVLFSS